MVTRSLDGIELIKPNQWEESYAWVENVNTSEAGTDLVTVIRSNKLTVSASFNCTTLWYKKFFELSQRMTLELDTYNPLTGTHATRAVRMRDFSASFQQYSDHVQGTEGLWVVSFSLIEF